MDNVSIRPIDMTASAILPAHAHGFKVDRLVGDQDWGFVQFLCPVILQDRYGRHEHPTGTCMIYEPLASRYYHAVGGEQFLHTWFLARGPGIAECVKAFNLPIHEAMLLGQLPQLEEYIRNVRHERVRRLPHWQDAVTDLSYGFFLNAAVALASKTDHLTLTQRKKSATLKEVRAIVHAQSARPWSVAQMAELAQMNATRFAMSYTNEFEVSPLNDLINARLRHAKRLLKNSTLPLKQIASECGLGRVEHFVRLFHERIGLTPGQVRNDPSSVND